MALSTVAKTKRDMTVVISDLNDVHSLEVKYERGDLNLTVPGPTVNLFLDRGVIGDDPSIRYGDDQPMTLSISGDLTDVSDAAYTTLTEILTNSGFFKSTWVSTKGASGEVKTVNVKITIEGTDHGDASDHTITCGYVFLTGSVADGDPITCSLSGTSYQLYPVCT